MATLIQSPPKFSYAGNLMPLIFEIDQTATAAVITINSAASLPAYNSKLTLYFDNEQVVFTFRHATLQDFYNEISTNYIIVRYFSATIQANIITLTSYKKVALNLEISKTANFSPCIATAVDGGAGLHRIFLGVDIEKNGIYKPTNFDKSHKAIESRVSFNIAPAFVFEDFKIPANALTNFAPFLTFALKYRLRFSEHYATTTTQTLFSETPLFALNGVFSEKYQNTSVDASVFLTASPRYLVSRDDEPRFLSILATDTLFNARIEIIAYDFDQQANVINKTLFDLVAGQILHIPVSYHALNLHQASNAPFFKYELRITYTQYSIQKTTETVTIECSRGVFDNYKTFLFTNSRGGVDTISFTGETEEKAEFQKVEILKTLGERHEIASTDKRIKSSFKQYTNYYEDYNLFSYLEELFLAKQVFLFENDILIPIEIMSNDFDKGNLSENMWATSFEYTFKKDDRASNLTFAPAFSLPSSIVSISQPLQINSANDVSEIE